MNSRRGGRRVMQCGEAIKELRRHAGLSQQVFATRLGISVSGLQNYEAGKVPTLRNLILFWNTAADAGRDDLREVLETHVREQTGRLGLGLERLAELTK